jgi:hypothetical protein
LTWGGTTGSLPAVAEAQDNWSFSHIGYLQPPGQFEIPIDVDVGATGLVAVADFGSGSVLSFSEDGEFLWEARPPESGRRRPPALTLVDVGPNGKVSVLDISRQCVWVFSSEGSIISGFDLPFRMHRVDDMVGLPDGGFALAGRTLWKGHGADTLAIHVFDPGLRHLRSFGPLPPSRHPDETLSWGVGSLSLTDDGRLLFGRKVPYEILTYAISGEVLNQLQAPFDIGDVQEAFGLMGLKDRVRAYRELSNLDLQIPSGAAEIGFGRILSQRTFLSEGKRVWDILDAAGRAVQTWEVPGDWLYPSAISQNLSRAYVLARRGTNRAVVIVKFSRSGR